MKYLGTVMRNRWIRHQHCWEQLSPLQRVCGFSLHTLRPFHASLHWNVNMLDQCVSRVVMLQPASQDLCWDSKCNRAQPVQHDLHCKSQYQITMLVSTNCTYTDSLCTFPFDPRRRRKRRSPRRRRNRVFLKSVRKGPNSRRQQEWHTSKTDIAS